MFENRTKNLISIYLAYVHTSSRRCRFNARSAEDSLFSGYVTSLLSSNKGALISIDTSLDNAPVLLLSISKMPYVRRICLYSSCHQSNKRYYSEMDYRFQVCMLKICDVLQRWTKFRHLSWQSEQSSCASASWRWTKQSINCKVICSSFSPFIGNERYFRG